MFHDTKYLQGITKDISPMVSKCGTVFDLNNVSHFTAASEVLYLTARKIESFYLPCSQYTIIRENANQNKPTRCCQDGGPAFDQFNVL